MGHDAASDVGLMGRCGAVLWVHGGCCPGERGQSRWGLVGRRWLILLCHLVTHITGAFVCGPTYCTLIGTYHTVHTEMLAKSRSFKKGTSF
jgi:hypothetical protein